jgi:toxin ParE1/3/4
LRALARADIVAAVDWYRVQAGPATAEAFASEVEDATARIARVPGMGSLRWSDMLDLPGLRCVSLRRFPYLVFHVERGDHIEIWRVLHSARDIPVPLREPG